MALMEWVWGPQVPMVAWRAVAGGFFGPHLGSTDLRMPCLRGCEVREYTIGS